MILFSFNCIIKRSIFLSILENLCQHSWESLLTFHGIFLSILRNPLEHSQNLFEHSLESLRTFPGIFPNIPRNLLQHSPGILWNIPRNVKIITFPRILVNIPPIQLFSAFFIVQNFQSPDFSGSRFSGSGSRVWVQILEVAQNININE